MNSQWDRAKEIVSNSQNIVFLGGAGVSTASNIPDFRSATGIYNRENNTSQSVEYTLSKQFFEDNPEGFSRFYKGEIVMLHAKPNRAHDAVTKLEKSGKLIAAITQNIDGLHQKAGTTKVIEIHGSYLDEICTRCQKHYSLAYALQMEGVVRCECGGFIRPNVVLYGEKLDPDVFEQACIAVSKADTMIVAGTTLLVYPAAGLIRRFSGNLIIINKGKTKFDKKADVVLDEDVGEVLTYITEGIDGTSEHCKKLD